MSIQTRATYGGTTSYNAAQDKLPPIYNRNTVGYSGRVVEEDIVEERDTYTNNVRGTTGYNAGGSRLSVETSQTQYGLGKNGAVNGAYQAGKQPFSIDNFDVNDGRPLQLVIANPGQFILNREAVDELVGYEGNVAFVTVAGKYRTGKSFLLNKLLGLRGQNGFKVDPSIDSCTQGIWIWSKPVFVERDNLYVFFMDTEGTNSLEKSTQHDTKIFALSILMSSFFVYNSVGVIDENAINELSLTTQLSKNIAVSADEQNSEYSLSYFTPKFMWLLRDFTLDLLDSRGKPISASQYLENALTDQSTANKTSETNKKIRQALLNFFKDRDCTTLVRPVTDEAALRKLDRLQDGQIRPEFLNQLKKLKEKIFSKVTPKQLRGVNLTPRMYFSAVQDYVDSINKGSIPTISTAWEHLVESEAQEAYDSAVSLYEVALKQFFFTNTEEPKSIDDIYHILKNIRDQTLEKYNKLTAFVQNSTEVKSSVQLYKDKLKEYLDDRENAAILINEELAQSNNQELLTRLSADIKANLAQGSYSESSIALFNEDFLKMLTDYEESAKGLDKCKIMIRFLSDFNQLALQSIIVTIKKDYERNQNKLIQDKNKSSLIEDEYKNKIKILEQNSFNYQEQINRLNKDKQLTEERNKQLERDVARLSANQMKPGETDSLKKEIEKKDKDIIDLQTQHEKDLAEIKANSQKKACCTIF